MASYSDDAHYAQTHPYCPGEVISLAATPEAQGVTPAYFENLKSIAKPCVILAPAC